MTFSLLSIGDEVLNGQTIDTNSAYLADILWQKGCTISSHRTVPDDIEKIQQTLHEELSQGHSVITIGGLGPTVDDRTREAIAQLLSLDLSCNLFWKQHLENRYGKEFPTIDNQSLQIPGATLLANSVGTAPGFSIAPDAYPNTHLFALPGPPLELRAVLPALLEQMPSTQRQTHTLEVIGLKEHEVDALLRELQLKWPSIQIGIYPSFSLIKVRLQAEEELPREAVAFFENGLQNHIVKASSLEQAILSRLEQLGWTLSTAESCTAGALASRLCSISGASKSFLGSAVTYQNENKKSLLDVPENILSEYGAVSAETVKAMAEGAQKLFESDISIATSGFLGPDGGTQKNPVGTVYLGIALPGKTTVKRLSLHGTREAICEQAVQMAMETLLLAL